MNKRQQKTLINFISVILVTTLVIVGMINVKDWISHTESMRTMNHLSGIIFEYREKRGLVPSESYIASVEMGLPGFVRLGELHYRAQWIDIESTEDEILAYVEKDYHSFIIRDGYIVLFLSGNVEYKGKEEFRTLLAKQQTPLEIEMTGK